ncbi:MULTISPECIES: GerAB/ArcD/ProY family transporter [Bacillaceae]|uniref:GerAB/ArcD/ProY family transporter n=1 Tax=Niallia endozanthoxylica TaxID=2036016 RepID=A0A5J5GSF4_9BACI|nr:GerAB/ArcD/ProY family transporter [Niallia endozanthoxylica]KAA9011191.1 GerAB/ArcD/ProY family transporter [Niallia endozanthoxylica]
MKKARISPGQLFSLITLFNLGTSLVVPLGMDAKQDAWIAILLGLAGGLLLFLVYGTLFHLYPSISLTGYIREILGKYIGWPLSFFYILFFIYGAARDLRDGGDLLVASAYDQTPLFAINALMIVAVVYVLHQGIEVLARLSWLYFMIILLVGMLGNLFVLTSGVVDVKNVLPVLGRGWKPVFNTVYSQTFMFPFGETICFTMILPLLRNQKEAIKMGMAAMAFGGIALSYTILVEIAVLGVDMASRSTFPLLSAISLVNIANFLQRLDAIAVLTVIIGVFFKVVVFSYAALVGVADLFQVQNQQKLSWPIGMVILFSSMMIASDFSDHLEEGKFALRSIFVFFSVVIPLLLLIVALTRKRIG